MKKTYKKPQFNIERFVPNEFCIACGTVDLNCNVYLEDYDKVHFPHDIYLETNGRPGLQPGEDKLVISEVESCGQVINVKADDIKQGYVTIKGYEDYLRWPAWIYWDSAMNHYHSQISFKNPVGAERS